MGEKISGAEYISRFLKKHDVTHVFFVMAILRKTLAYLEEAGVKRIAVHSEKGAAYFADGYARVSKKPGIAMAQSVGAANLAAGLQDAYLGHSPVIAITGRKKFSAQYRNSYQEILHWPMFDAVTKYHVNVDTAEQLPHLLQQAFREATSGAPQPVHLDLLGLSGDIIEKEYLEADFEADIRYSKFPSIRIEPDENDICRAANAIKASRRPVIISGSGAVSSGAGKEIYLLSKKLSIPLASSCHGKALVPDSYSLNAGCVGSYSSACANKIVSEADLVIYIGCGVGDQVTLDWTIPHPQVQKIQIDVNPSELGRNYPNTLGILGDARKAVSKLIHACRGFERKSSWSDNAQQVIAAWKDERNLMRDSQNVPIRPERLCKDISDLLPSDAIVIADTGYTAIWACRMIDFNSFDQMFFRSAGSLGWAFPAAIGAKCAAPDRTVICFIGDGGFWYHISELETASRWNLNTITIVNNNSAWGQSIDGVEKAYGGKKGNRDDMFSFKEVDFSKIAKEIGCLGIRVEKPEEIQPAIRQALNSNLPVVIDVVTHPLSKPAAAWRP